MRKFYLIRHKPTGKALNGHIWDYRTTIAPTYSWGLGVLFRRIDTVKYKIKDLVSRPEFSLKDFEIEIWNAEKITIETLSASDILKD